jgi:prepilin-type N-terminal cleavage/methylation domain-containing protein
MRRRSGLTLVEMLVALALSVLIMAILSEAFVTGLKAFRQLKGLADLEQQLRTAANILRRDLKAPHFEGERKLSQLTATGKAVPNFSPPLPTVAQIAPYQLTAPELGYFRINEIRPGETLVTGAATVEYVNPLSPVRTPDYVDTNDELIFTSRLRGNSRDQMFFGSAPGLALDFNSGMPHTRFDAAVPNGTYASQWAEIAYFLNADTSRPFGQARMVSYFNLYRRQLLLVPDAFNGAVPQVVPTAGAGVAYPSYLNYYADYDVSAWQVPNTNNFFFNTPSDIQLAIRRFSDHTTPAKNRWPAGSGPNTNRLLPILGARQGSDLLLSNVISFDVKVLDPLSTTSPGGAAAELPADPNLTNRFVDIGYSAVNGAYQAAAGTSFDTGCSHIETYFGATVNPQANANLQPTHLLPFNMLKVTIRVYDPKTRQTREATIVVDM